MVCAAFWLVLVWLNSLSAYGKFSNTSLASYLIMSKIVLELNASYVRDNTVVWNCIFYMRCFTHVNKNVLYPWRHNVQKNIGLKMRKK